LAGKKNERLYRRFVIESRLGMERCADLSMPTGEAWLAQPQLEALGMAGAAEWIISWPMISWPIAQSSHPVPPHPLAVEEASPSQNRPP
jgi:hypothetical protein